MSKKIGLFYSPAKGSTERIALTIAKKAGIRQEALHLVEKTTNPEELIDYELLILGISTVGREVWDARYTSIGWDFLIPRLEDVDFAGKKVAIFGLGNQIEYPDTFVDGMGILAQRLIDRNAILVGRVSPAGYDFNDSEAFFDGWFHGLPLDEDNQPDLSEARIDKWLENLRNQW